MRSAAAFIFLYWSATAFSEPYLPLQLGYSGAQIGAQKLFAAPPGDGALRQGQALAAEQMA